MTETWATWAVPPTGKSTIRMRVHHMLVHLHKHAGAVIATRCSGFSYTLLRFQLHAAPVSATRCSGSGYTLLRFQLHAAPIPAAPASFCKNIIGGI